MPDTRVPARVSFGISFVQYLVYILPRHHLDVVVVHRMAGGEHGLPTEVARLRRMPAALRSIRHEGLREQLVVARTGPRIL